MFISSSINETGDSLVQCFSAEGTRPAGKQGHMASKIGTAINI